MNYYSALDKKDQSLDYEPVGNFKIKNSLAFVYTIETGILPQEFDRCDLLYTEIPWEHGYDIFNSRADHQGLGYETFIKSLYTIINDNAGYKPVVIVCGKKLLSKLLRPSFTHEVDLNGYKALAVIYNAPKIKDIEGLDYTNFRTLLQGLAERFNCVGDFACGFGNTGEIFFEAGKDFVMSDINPRCIGCIQKHYE